MRQEIIVSRSNLVAYEHLIARMTNSGGLNEKRKILHYDIMGCNKFLNGR